MNFDLIQYWYWKFQGVLLTLDQMSRKYVQFQLELTY